MPAAYRTDRGRVRATNEDSLLADHDSGIFILADGLGGHQAGEVASSLAVQETYAYLKDVIRMGPPPGPPEADLPGLITEAILRAHLIVHRKSETDPGLRGMGATLVVLVIRNTTACTGHVGDSRAYIMRERLEQITRDHTAGDYFSLPGIVSRRRPSAGRSHMLSQSVGISETIAPEMHSLELGEGDIMLLCSDGLTDMLSDDEIEEVIRSHRDSMEDAASALVNKANYQGGLDNISVILVRK